MYDVAAGSAAMCFVAGVVTVVRRGWKRGPWVVVLGTAAAGALPLVMLLFAKRWMQGYFA